MDGRTYREMMADDVRRWLEEHKEEMELWKWKDAAELEELLYNRLFNEDGITGDGPIGCRFGVFRGDARSFVLANIDEAISIIAEDFRDLLVDGRAADFLADETDGRWAFIDSAVRCRLLPDIIDKAVWDGIAEGRLEYEKK